MRKVKKPFYIRREELKEALYRLESAVNRYKMNHQVAELGIIAMELRGLLLKEALLLDLTNEKNFPLELFTIPPVNDIVRNGLTHLFVADSVNLKCKKPWTVRVMVQEWLNMPVAEIKGSIFTPTRLIAEIANTVGPAHYSSEISSALLEMRQISLGGVPSHFRSLMNFTEVLIELIKRFLATH